jgi:hypothetical protein
MTVSARMPERMGRGAIVRRVCFAVTTLVLVIAFAATLSAIASTTGALRPDGQAAAMAKQRSAPTTAPHQDCPRHRGGDRDQPV